MDAGRWERLQEIFHAAADLPEPGQRRFVTAACGEDTDLATEAFALLAADARGGGLLDRGVAQTAHDILSDGRNTVPTRAFGRYRITRLLGEGGMGIVYLAERSDLGAVAAIKILRDAWLSPARRERFAAEQRMLATLNHPSIARLYDADTLGDGTPWFVMEYVEGQPITEYCASKNLSRDQRLHLFRDVCEAVQHAHSHLVIHRDLKPSNILVSNDGRVKLLDFGIAKQLDGLEGPDVHTRTGMPLMTPAYAAPEQLTGGTVGIRTDVYSLGVVLYELIVGRRPYEVADRTPGQIETMITTLDPERPSVASRKLAGQSPTHGWPSATKSKWADLDVICLTAMHKDPARRYASAEALVRDIDHYIKGEPLEARADSAGYRIAKFVRRNSAAVWSAAAVFVLVTGLVVFYTVRLTIARNAAVTQATLAERVQGFMLDLFEGDDQSVGPSDTLKVVTVVDRGLEKARSLDAEPEVQAELYLTLGGIYQKLGNFSRADSLMNLALTKKRALFGEQSADVAKSLVALGGLRIDEAKFDDAERVIREGLAMARKTLPPKDPGITGATAALGRVLQERGSYDAAIPLLQDVVARNEAAHATPAVLAASLAALADVNFYAGHYAVSDSLNEIVLATYRRVYGDHHPLVAGVLVNLGASQFDRGDYVKAEAFDRQALEITRTFYGENHYEVADNLTKLGRALEMQKRFADATAALNRALAINERVYGPVHPAVASTINELGNVAEMQDNYDEAERDFRRILQIYRAVYGDKHYLIGLATSNLATVFLDRKDYRGAEPLFREAVRRYTNAQGPDHMNTGIARIKLGRTLLRENKFAEARDESLAGYQIMSKQASPSNGFLVAARKDLVAEYDSLKQPALALKFRAELADTIKRK